MRTFVICSLVFVVFYPFVPWRYVLSGLAAIELALQVHRWRRRRKENAEFAEGITANVEAIVKTAEKKVREVKGEPEPEDEPEAIWEPVRMTLKSKPFAWRNSETGEMRKTRPE